MGNQDKNEISVSELIAKTKSLIHFLFSKWLIILPFCILAGIFGYFLAYTQKPKYTGALTFVLSVESKASNLGGLASQFGIDLGGNGGSDVFAGDNIITLFKSKKMLSRVVFKKPPNQEDLLINILVRSRKLDIKWQNISHLKGVFPFTEKSALSPVQDSLLTELVTIINSDLLSVNRIDKKLSVYEVNTTSTSETFSTYLTRYLVDETAAFYIDTKTSLAKQNLTMLQKEADSLRRLLGSSISSTASEVDRTFMLNPALQVQRSSIQKGQLNTTVLGTAYGEVVKNLELAKINLQKETPLYQIIDVPSIPLKAIRPSKLIYAIISMLIGLLLITTYLLVRRNNKKYNTITNISSPSPL